MPTSKTTDKYKGNGSYQRKVRQEEAEKGKIVGPNQMKSVVLDMTMWVCVGECGSMWVDERTNEIYTLIYSLYVVFYYFILQSPYFYFNIYVYI